ncbi:MAG: hypothetical protein M0Z50_08995 [Planctomycetia bacterium]|nr:hypothetical protein [Planctomycetia bacterium]
MATDVNRSCGYASHRIEKIAQGVPAMLTIPFKMDWAPTYPKARKSLKKMDSEKWERIASPNLMRFFASIFIIPGTVVALLLILVAICYWMLPATPLPSPNAGYHTGSTLVSASSTNASTIP